MRIAAQTPDQIAANLAGLVPQSASRQLVALAGPPASGKSTAAEALVSELIQQGRPTGLLPMDGFHLDNAILDARGLRTRKGAPETFDLAGFAATLERVVREEQVYVPTFDRARDATIAASAEITSDQNVVIVEGNYLLLDAPVWRDLRRFWDMSVFLDVPEDVLEMRLIQRWRDHGFDEIGARAKAERNDLPNARLVLHARLASVDVTISA